MLPLIMLYPTELATFAPEPNSADLLPQDALEPTAVFADILQVGLQPMVQTATDNGRPVPPAGNGLPPFAASEAGSGGPANDRALPIVEPFSIVGRPAAGLVEARTAPPAESRLPALPTPTAAEPAPRVPASPEPALAPNAQRLPADNQQQAAQRAVAARVTADGERISPERDPRPQLPPDGSVLRPAQETATAALSASARADLAEAVLGRAQRSSPLAESLSSGGGHRDSQPAPSSRDNALYAGIAREFRQPAPVAPPGQSAQIPVDSLIQADSPLAQAPAATPGPQGAPTQLVQTPAPLAGGATSAAAQAQAPIDVPVRDTVWSSALGERVVVMANNQLQNAEIRLTPAELGPLRVQVAVEDGAANVTFHAQHALTREAIEQALPRLRELFAENGLTLNQADVGEQAGPGVKQGNSETAEDGALGNEVFAEADDETAADSVPATDRPRSRAEGLVDTFA